jgi:hypothetical protein
MNAHALAVGFLTPHYMYIRTRCRWLFTVAFPRRTISGFQLSAIRPVGCNRTLFWFLHVHALWQVNWRGSTGWRTWSRVMWVHPTEWSTLLTGFSPTYSSSIAPAAAADGTGWTCIGESAATRAGHSRTFFVCLLRFPPPFFFPLFSFLMFMFTF